MYMNYKNISKAYLLELLRGQKGRFFSVNFIKKDGTERKLNGRLSVGYDRKTTRKKDNSYITEKGYLPVYDVQKYQYRTINLNTVNKVIADHVTYFVNDTY